MPAHESEINKLYLQSDIEMTDDEAFKFKGAEIENMPITSIDAKETAFLATQKAVEQFQRQLHNGDDLAKYKLKLAKDQVANEAAFNATARIAEHFDVDSIPDLI